MKIKLTPILLFCLISTLLSAQTDPAIWNSIAKIEDNKFVASIPDGWKKVNVTDGSGIDYKYDFSGVGIPGVTHDNSPLYANFTIVKMQGNKTDKAWDQAMAEFSNFSDRLTEPGYDHDSTNAAIKSGETGRLLHTRYYRRSKVSNYSKYYMVVYSQKADQTYLITFHFQYKDTSYDIERSARFKDYVMAVLAHFEVR